MIHFDFEDRYQDELIVGSAISRREGVVFSVVLHALAIAAILFIPTLAFLQPSPEEQEAERQRHQEELRRQQQEQEPPRFVFVQPRVEMPAPPPPRAELSDLDRQAQTRDAAPTPRNPLPFSRGNSAERTESAETERARGPESPQPDPVTPDPPQPEQQIARNLPPAQTGLQRPVDVPRPRSGGALGDALRNLERYVQGQTFNNPQGGNQDPGSQIQFDTKGVEFGPWIRRFVAQVRRNWFVPMSAMSFRGRVVLQFNIHRDGRITDLVVLQPSSIDSFNRAAYQAIAGSNPTEPLPPEYPDDKALFTVTFYYNEQP